MTLNENGSSPSDNSEQNADLNNLPTDNLDANSANPSDAGDNNPGAKEPATSLLDAVKSVVNKGRDGESPTPGQEGAANLADAQRKSSDATKDGTTKTDTDPTTGDKLLPFHNHPRFQQTLRESREGKVFKQQLEALRPQAEENQQIRTFMDTNNLSGEEVGKGFVIMAAMKNDPLKARELLSGYMRQLDMAAGELLPDDLQRMVDEGSINVEAAKAMARAQFEARHAGMQTEVIRQQQAQQREQYAQEQQMQAQIGLANSVNNALVSWEGSVKTSDPDYAKKQELVYEKLKAVRADSGPPGSPDEAVQRAQRAYDEVTQYLRSIMPARRSVTPTPSGESSATALPQPKTLLEVVRLAAEGRKTA